MTTSSSSAGLQVVPLVTVPERVWAAAEARVNETIAASNVDCTSLVKTTPWDQRDHETGVSRCVLQRLMVIAIAPTNENRES